MNMRVNLVLIALTLLSFVLAYDTDHREFAESRDLRRLGGSKLPSRTKIKVTRPVTSILKAVTKPVGKLNSTDLMNEKSKLPVDSDEAIVQAAKEAELRGRPRPHRKMKRALMALLVAYKLKFALLIPTMLGGLIMLLTTTALAGFFFALFAAVLGLKGH